jgi:CheY-like chemotaxis protein
MAHKIENRSAQILVIESLSTRRFGIVEALKSLGFKGVKSAASLQEGQLFMEQSGVTPDWVITSPFADQSVNILRFLAYIVQQPDLASCLVSLVYEKNLEWCLLKAFELGLFSCHLKTDDMTSTKQSFQQLLERGDHWKWREPLVAGSYLRDLLKKDRRQGDSTDSQLKLERSLLSLFPEAQEPLLIEMVTVLIDSNKSQLALAVLNKAGTFSEKNLKKVEELSQKALSANSSAKDPATFAQTWDIGRCILVDPDASGRNLVEKSLREMGATDIIGFADGEEALAALKGQPEPDLIVQEWRLPKVSGDRFVQRVRLMGFQTVPIIVFSSLVKSNDRYILREMGVSEVFTKPLSEKKLMALIMQVIEEEKRPRGEKATELRIRKALQTQNIRAAKHLYETHFKDGKGPHKVITILSAEIAFAEGRFQEADGFATEALHLNGEDTLVLNLLGKINLKLKQHKKAELFFAKAESLSPGNVERLCQLAEVKAELNNLEGSDELLESAKKIDPEAPIIQSSAAKIAVISTDEGRLKSVMNRIESQGELVAFLNNRAVGMTAQGQIKESVKLYQKALKSMPKSMKHFAPTILYNMALALIKVGGLESEAALTLKHALSMPPDGVTGKIKSLEERVNQAIAKGEPMVLKTSESIGLKTSTISADGDPAVVDPLFLHRQDLSPGDYCCYKIFQSPTPDDPKVTVLLEDKGKSGAKTKKMAS